jgi:AcrR family transcriptional regulator
VPLRRGAPRSEHGATIVAAILDATAELLDGRSLDGVTTNTIAERAGVSVGSLYQYFGSKEAIVAALAERLDVRDAGRELAALAGVTTTERAAAALVGAMAVRDAVRAALLAGAPAGWMEETSERGSAAVRARLAALLTGDRTAERAFVAYHAVRSAVRAAHVQAPEMLDDPRFAAELTLLVRRYLG